MRALLIALLFFPSVVLADFFDYPHKTFNVRLICGGGVDCDRAQEVFRSASNYIDNAVNAKFQIVDRVIVDHDMIGRSVVERMLKWQIFILDLHKETVDVNYIVLDAYPRLVDYVDFSSEQVLGMVQDIGIAGKVKNSVAFSKLVGSDTFSARIVIHELGHLLGARHGDKGIMFPSMDVAQYSEGYSLESIYQIQDHLRSLN